LVDASVESAKKAVPKRLELGSRRSLVVDGSFVVVKWKLGRSEGRSQKGPDEGNRRGD
jgi:hypothetical protein